MRDNLPLAIAALGAVAVVLTEGLSLFDALRAGYLAAGWTLAGVLAVAALLRNRPKFVTRFALPESLLPLIIALVALTTLVIAAVAAPNNWDSMTYHLPRVAHWAQNGSVGFYPTHNLRQLHLNPFAEYGMLHLYLLAGGDRFVNLAQWLAMLASVVVVGLVARELGADRLGQILAGVICATLPTGILESSSTQNDYVLALWLACLAWFTLRLTSTGNPKARDVAGCGLSLGLAILTKGTAYLFAWPFVLWISWRCRRKPAAVIAILALAFALNLGHFSRNYRLWGSPLGPPEEIGKYANNAISLKGTLSNFLRGAAVQFTTPAGVGKEWVESAVLGVHRWIGADPNDPDTTWAGTKFQVIESSHHEDLQGNPLHLALITVSAAAGLLSLARVRWKLDTPAIYGLALVCGLLAFCTYLKWQPWHVRLLLPMFVIASPLVAMKVPARLAAPLALVLLLCSVPDLVNNRTRPLLGSRSIFRQPRLSQYFANAAELEPGYAQLSAQGNRAIGLDLGVDDWEYPLWVILRATAMDARLVHVGVSNSSASLPPEQGVREVGAIITVRGKSVTVRRK